MATKYQVGGLHPVEVVVGDKRPMLAPGESATLSAEDEKVEHNKMLMSDGVLTKQESK